MRILYFTFIVAILSLTSCKKDDIQTLPMGAININNAVIDGATVKMGTNLLDSASVNGYKRWSFISGNTEFRVFPTISSSTPYYNNTLKNTNAGDWYSLYLHGPAASAEGILVKENLPYFAPEQCAIKVVNLSPNGSGLNIAFSATGDNDFTNLAYKQVTDYKTYDIPFSTLPANFQFQLKDATGTVLASSSFTQATLNGIRYKSATLVIRGMVDGTGTSALGLIYVPNY